MNENKIQERKIIKREKRRERKREIEKRMRRMEETSQELEEEKKKYGDVKTSLLTRFAKNIFIQTEFFELRGGNRKSLFCLFDHFGKRARRRGEGEVTRNFPIQICPGFSLNLFWQTKYFISYFVCLVKI